MREKKNEWVTANEQIWWCDKQIICKYEETFRHTKKDKNKNASCLKGYAETHQSVLHTKANTISISGVRWWDKIFNLLN